MGAAGLGLQLQAAPAWAGREQLPVGVGGFAGRVMAVKGGMAAQAGQGQVDAAGWLGRHSQHVGPVGLAHQPFGEQLAQGPV